MIMTLMSEGNSTPIRRIVETTVGRGILSQVLPKDFGI